MAIPVYESEYEMETLPELAQEYESELAGEVAGEISPIRRIYLDAMMEHMGHMAAEAESEQEAAEGFLPLIPMIAGKLLPLAVKAIPKIARALPKIARTVSRVTPRLNKGVSTIARGLFRNRRTRPLVRAVPSIARRTVATIARQAARGRPVTPQTAQRILVQKAKQVLRTPGQAAATLQRAQVLDRHFHRAAGLPAPAPARACPRCGVTVRRAPRVCCRCCGQLIQVR